MGTTPRFWWSAEMRPIDIREEGEEEMNNKDVLLQQELATPIAATTSLQKTAIQRRSNANSASHVDAGQEKRRRRWEAQGSSRTPLSPGPSQKRRPPVLPQSGADQITHPLVSGPVPNKKASRSATQVHHGPELLHVVHGPSVTRIRHAPRVLCGRGGPRLSCVHHGPGVLRIDHDSWVLPMVWNGP